MGRTGWIAGLALSMALITCNTATAETIAPLTLKVLVLDQVGVPADALREARHETSRIFDALQITVVWVEGGLPQGHYLVIKIVTKAPNLKSREPNMLGVAALSQEGLSTHAWLFYSRILNQRQALRLDVSLLLGHVLAHEMGHLLLPDGSHSVAGLMKGGWDRNQARLATMGSLGFDAGQAAAIRARLRNWAGPNQ